MTLQDKTAASLKFNMITLAIVDSSISKIILEHANKELAKSKANISISQKDLEDFFVKKLL